MPWCHVQIVSDESSSDSSSEVHNSATEISTDSEFAHDDPTPTRELPAIALDDLAKRTRASGKGGRSYPKKIQVTSGYLQRPIRESGPKHGRQSVELKLKPLVLPSPPTKPALAPSRTAAESGYSLNRTQSTGGIAAKVSLELKKKYLLGESSVSGIQKSGSVSTLDTKFKTFQDAITDCQKLLRPATEISASMQTFCSKLDERMSPQSPLIAEEEKPEEVRPRSPVHQTSIIVPQIDWTKNNHVISSDSLASSDSDNNIAAPNFDNIPTVEIHEAQSNEEDALFDSLVDQNAQKSITSEKKSLNQPKTLPHLEIALPEIHNSLHVKLSKKEEDSQKNSSGLSSPDEPITAALTETELSDWARDDEASDDLEDVLNECENKTNKFEGSKNMIITEALNGLLSSNLDNIEFMDTETSSDDGIQNSQDGYVLLKNEDEFAEDSLSPNLQHETPVKNTGYCIIEPITHKLKVNANEHEDDSLLVLETAGTTTEENTLSDSTVKNVTEISAEKLESKDALEAINEQTSDTENIEFDEHCQRLQSKVEFGNAKDSINVRKSRRKSKSDSPQKPDLIQEERIDKDVITLNLSPTPHTPDILYNKEIIKKERDVNKKLIQEMVMNKMRAENKSLERKKRVRSGVSPTSPFSLMKSATVSHISIDNNRKPTDVVSQINLDNSRKSTYSTSSSNYSTPDVLLSTNLIPLEKLPDDFTPKAPPRLHRLNSEESHRKLEKLKQAAAKLQEKEEIEGVVNVERRNSWLYSNDTLSKKKNGSFRRSKSGDSETPKKSPANPTRTKSIQEMPKGNEVKEINLEESKRTDQSIVEDAKSKKKGKDRERRKSITKMITTLFTKKSPSGLFSKLSPKSKEISKEFPVKQPIRRNSLSETTQRIALTPPPVPPLPMNYAIKATDESSDGESEYKKDHRGSTDTLDKVGTLEMSTSSNTGRRSSKAQKALRQAQLKRHRMAQEIQRKLEETEVKTKELEERGVSVEKALRGEGNVSEYSGKDECELLQEWFDLMRDRTELRRYEKELIVRAQELELEDRHARLQCELRARLENNEPKTEEELKVEEEIINEMMSIVSERDSLIATIEEDRLRYTNEDRDMEEQMLAKGLRLTPIKSPEK